MSGSRKDSKRSPYFGDYPPNFFDFIVNETSGRVRSHRFRQGHDDSQFGFNPIVTSNHDYIRPPIAAVSGGR
jgi:hypothetical protein